MTAFRATLHPKRDEASLTMPEEFAAHIRSEIAKWGKVLKGSRVPLE